MQIKTSILLSIFKRKGGEGPMTRIVTEQNKPQYAYQFALLDENEGLLICFKEDDMNWIALTDGRLLGEQKGMRLSIPYSELSSVDLALMSEFKNNVKSKLDFTRLNLVTLQGNTYSITVEQGLSFRGIFQVLHHLASKAKKN
jgi:hypothetical protein